LAAATSKAAANFSMSGIYWVQNGKDGHLSAEIFPQHVHRYESDRCFVRGESQRASGVERKEFVVEVFGGDEREREIEKRGREEVKKEE
jgi:hypothetical protein